MTAPRLPGSSAGPRAGAASKRAIAVGPPWLDHGVFDVADRLDGLRCWPTERLVAAARRSLREQWRLRVEELAVVRGARRARPDRRVGRRPGWCVGAKKKKKKKKKKMTGAEWARRAPHVAPADLARLARTKSKPTVDDALGTPGGAASPDVVAARTPECCTCAGRCPTSTAPLRDRGQPPDRPDAPAEGSAVGQP